MRRPLLVLLVLLSLLLAAAARADDAAAPLVAAGEAAEAEMRFGEAVRLYREALVKNPSSPRAPRARARAEDLEAHAEGAFEPLARLEKVRRSAALAADPTAIAALEADADRFPPGRVRGEARLLCSGAWSGRLGQPARAVAPLERVVDDAAADRLTRSVALRQLVELRERTGDLASAVRDVDRHPDLGPELWARVHREARRVWLRAGSAAFAGLVLLVGIYSALRLARRVGARAAVSLAIRPIEIALAAWIGLAGGALAYAYDASSLRPFLLLAAGVLALDVAARAWSAAVARTLAPAVPPVARAIVCAAGVVAVAFLALDRSDPAFLESFGL